MVSTFLLIWGLLSRKKKKPISPMNSSTEVAAARTSEMLKWFSSKDCVRHLLLSPDDSLVDEVQISRSSDMEPSTCQHKKLCYLRLLLHAFRGGAFEEGAVICAPKLPDITLLRCRPENNEPKLQVRQSLLALGKWEFELPDDPIARESFRQPIGFLATGFVRGSKKPVAVGMGEATRLASLRQEQRSQILGGRTKEIFVLVRNLRSSAYGLALATIVLGREEDDVEFLCSSLSFFCIVFCVLLVHVITNYVSSNSGYMYGSFGGFF